MKKRWMKSVLLLLMTASMLVGLGGCSQISPDDDVFRSEGEMWYFGFGSRQIIPDADGDDPLYIAGYQQGVEITGVLDYCEARAIWLDTGDKGVLMIGIDCIALDSGTVSEIRRELSDLENCAAVHVYATHTHAGVDTLGMWGPVGTDGKNPAYMDALLRAAAEAGREAAENRRAGSLYYGSVETEAMHRDSRIPEIYDANLYQLRFLPKEGGRGLRLYFYGAHAEALRGANTLLSRDYPGLLCDGVTSATGDDTMFFPGAIGGLVMTKSFIEDADAGPGALENLDVTGKKLVDYALSIKDEREISPSLKLSTTVFTVPMDNPIFLMYRILGILNNKAVQADSATGYAVETELSLLLLGDVALALLPGEIFPELVLGGAYGRANPGGSNPKPLVKIAEEKGLDSLLIVGLCNDEIGYIVPPSDFLVNKKLPYLDRTTDYKGEDHYEETNSVGPKCANALAEAFAAAAEALNCH